MSTLLDLVLNRKGAVTSSVFSSSSVLCNVLQEPDTGPWASVKALARLSRTSVLPHRHDGSVFFRLGPLHSGEHLCLSLLISPADLLSASYVPGTVLGGENTAVKRRMKDHRGDYGKGHHV